MSGVWEIVSIIVTAICSGGLVHFFTLESIKRKELASAEMEESKVDSQELENTDHVINLYKQALIDIKELNDKEKNLLQETIRNQDSKISELKSLLDANKLTIEDLTRKVKKLTSELSELKNSISNKCPFTNICEKYRDYIKA